MILYIDMDDTIADFSGGMADLDPELYIGDGPGWEERSRRVNELCWTNPRIFGKLEPIAGAKEGIQELKELYEIYFLSTPMWILPESFMDKRHWLHDHYGTWAEKRLILTHRKDLAIGDFLVDDTTRNGAGEFTGEHIHFGTEKWPNWPVVVNYLKTKALN